MTNLESLIKEYLSKETDYAIQIFGKWGIGKTFYYRQILEPLISETNTFHDNSKKNKPVYISLFGLNSIEEVATKIVLEFYQSKLFGGYLKRNKKVLKISGGILKMGLNGFLNSNKLGNVKDYLTDVSSVGKNVLDERELLICLDDLERRSKKLDIEDLLGYINSMVDSKIKILILANEETLINESNNNYKYLKEKVIGVSIPFPINPQETITQIIKHKFANFPVYHKFLLNNITILAEISIASDNNYRHLSYALDRFHDCFSEIQLNIVDSKNEILKVLEKEYENLFKIFLIFSIEYKSSNLNFEDKYKFSNKLVSISDLMIDIFEENINSKSDDEKVSSNEDFDFNYLKKKYKIDTNSFKLFDSFFNYITGISIFNIDEFIKEFCTIFHLRNGEVSPQYILLNRLASQECLYLSDEEYQIQINELIENAENGNYFPSEYLSVIGCIEAFNNPIDLDLIEVFERIKNGLNKAIKQQFEEFGEETSKFKLFGGIGSELQRDLYNFGKDTIKTYNTENQKNNTKDIWTKLLDDVKLFTTEYFNNTADIYHIINRTRISNYITIEQLITLIKESRLFNLSKFYDFFIEYLNNSETFLFERDYLNNLKSELLNINFEDQKRKKYYLDEIIKNIQTKIQ